MFQGAAIGQHVDRRQAGVVGREETVGQALVKNNCVCAAFGRPGDRLARVGNAGQRPKRQAMIEGQQKGFARLRINNAVVPCLYARVHTWGVLSDISLEQYWGAAAKRKISGIM